jgi:hypothetical protein
MIGDNQRLEWIWKSGLVNVEFSKLMLNIELDTPEFCQLKNWNPQACKRRLMIGFPRAVLLLETQETILLLLKTVTNTLMAEGPPGLDFVEPFIGSHDFNNKAEYEQWCSYLNQPFTEPRVFEEGELTEISGLKLALAEKHLSRLQTSMEYLKRTMYQVSAVMDPATTYDVFVRQTVAEISYDIWNYWSWKLITDACQNVQQQRVKFGASRSDRAKGISVYQYQA